MPSGPIPKPVTACGTVGTADAHLCRLHHITLSKSWKSYQEVLDDTRSAFSWFESYHAAICPLAFNWPELDQLIGADYRLYQLDRTLNGRVGPFLWPTRQI